MDRKFADGELVVHKTDLSHKMTVERYTPEGTVMCKWREKGGFKREEFVEAELEQAPPDYGPELILPKRPTY